MSQGPGWHIGSHEGQPLTLPATAFLRHAVVFGASGSGKTVACKVICEEALKSGIPVIAVDPQGDIASMQVNPPSGADVVVWTPGSDAARSLRLNPFGQTPPTDPAERTQWAGRQAVNIGALLGVADEDEKTTVIEAGIVHALENHLPLGSLEDLAELLENPDEELSTRLNQIARSRVPPEVARTLRRNSFGARGQILERGEPLEIDVLLGRRGGEPGKTRMSVIYLNVLLDQDSKSSFLGFLLEEIYSWMLRNPARSGGLQALLFIDELAPFVPPSNRKKPPCKEAFLLLIRQARKYGLGLLLASQNIGDVDYQALNQCNTWFLGSCRALQELNKARDVLGSRVSSPEAVAEALQGLPKGNFLLLSDEVFGDSRQRRIEIRHYDRAHRPLDIDGLRELKAGTSRVIENAEHSPSTPPPLTIDPPPPRITVRPRPGQAADQAPFPKVVASDPIAPARPVSPAPSMKAAEDLVPQDPLEGPSTQHAVPPRPIALSARRAPEAPPMSSSWRPFQTGPREDGLGSVSPLELRVSFRNPTLPVSPHGTQLDAILDLVPTKQASGPRPPIALILLLDRSGSMGTQSRLEVAREAALSASKALQPSDRIGLIAFNDTAEVMAHLSPLGSTDLRSALARLDATGGTRASAALEAAERQLSEHTDSAAIFFLTDGHTQNDHELCYDLAARFRRRGTSVFGFGVGTDWAEDFLDKVTDKAYDFLESASDAPRYFEARTRQFGGLLSRELRVSVESIGSARLLPALLQRSSSGLESETNVEDLGTGPVLTVKDVSAHGGALRVVLSFEVSAPAPGQLVVARIRVEGETVSGQRVDLNHTLVVPVSADRAKYERVDAGVVETLQRLHTKRVLVTAHEDVESKDPERVARGTRRLRGVTKRLDDMGEHELAKITRRVVEKLDSDPASANSPELKSLRQQTKRV